MKTLIFISLIFSTACAELYKVTLTRLDQNLYRDEASGVIIETKYCYEYASKDDAVLSFEANSYNNKIIFSSGTTCEIKQILK
jgi:hypothetical protein